MQRGYTLIELLIVITIMGLLVGASIAGFNTLNQRQTVLSAGKEVISLMRTAQQKSASGVKPAGTCDQLLGYSVIGTINTGVYSLNSVCNNSGSITTTKIKSAALASGVTFNSTFTVLFNTLTAGASGTVGDIKVKTASYSFTFTVNASGDITEKGIL